MRKVTIIGGGGIRTPLVVHGLVEAQQRLNLSEISLLDIDRERVELVAGLCRQVANQFDGEVKITTPASVEESVEGSSFVISSIRVGGIATRARDERLAIEHGIAGQETTGLGGLAMALRTIPVTLEHARVVEQFAPDAWFISFTNPAGLITQALSAHTNLKLIGICDTPSEMFHRIAQALKARPEAVDCDYFGLNHLGWIRRVTLNGQDVTARLLNDNAALHSLYHAELFDPAMIRALGMIPSEYLFFYYEQKRALANQQKAGASRGEEIAQLNAQLFGQLQSEIQAGRLDAALEIYRRYLQRRSGAYMKLEAEAGSAFQSGVEQQEDPFTAVTGYHRIALDVMTALTSDQPSRVVVNVANHGAIADLYADDVIEAPCQIDRTGARPIPVGKLPDSVCGLIQSVKEYERLTIRAAVEQSQELARMALLAYPLIGQWIPASQLIDALIATDEQHLSYLK
ncbi:MAG: 6-phospho-beta-glucosidase [Blastocatellia bacterium]